MKTMNKNEKLKMKMTSLYSVFSASWKGIEFKFKKSFECNKCWRGFIGGVEAAQEVAEEEEQKQENKNEDDEEE